MRYNSRIQDKMGKYGKLTILDTVGRNKHNKIVVRCLCDCGNTKDVVYGSLRAGITKSCGCEKTRKTIERSTTHNMCHSKEYKTWANAKARCVSKTGTRHRLYGSRGITMCDRWFNSFENFYEDMGNAPSDEYTIERIDNNKGYCKENCVWATRLQQVNNRGCNIFITHNDKTQTITQWSRELSIPLKTLCQRYYKGCIGEKLFFKGNLRWHIAE